MSKKSRNGPPPVPGVHCVPNDLEKGEQVVHFDLETPLNLDNWFLSFKSGGLVLLSPTHQRPPLETEDGRGSQKHTEENTKWIVWCCQHAAFLSVYRHIYEIKSMVCDHEHHCTMRVMISDLIAPSDNRDQGAQSDFYNSLENWKEQTMLHCKPSMSGSIDKPDFAMIGFKLIGQESKVQWPKGLPSFICRKGCDPLFIANQAGSTNWYIILCTSNF